VKKEVKQTRNRRIVELGPDTLSDKHWAKAENLDMKRSVTIKRSIIIRASAERCFEFISRQLEETPDWDPTLMWVNPVTIKHTRVGSMSRVNFSLDGVREEAVAMVRSFRPNRSLLWTTNHSNQLQERWELQPEPHGTLVTVTLGYNTRGWIFGRLADRLHLRGKVEKAVTEMLEKLKTSAESKQ
jgi:uncharacterized membrane protein